MQLGTSQVALVAMNPLANAGEMRDMGSIPGSGRSLEEGHGNPLQVSYLENPVDRGAWQATVHGITELDTCWSHACLAHNDHSVSVPCFGFACLCNYIFFLSLFSLGETFLPHRHLKTNLPWHPLHLKVPRLAKSPRAHVFLILMPFVQVSTSLKSPGGSDQNRSPPKRVWSFG